MSGPLVRFSGVVLLIALLSPLPAAAELSCSPNKPLMVLLAAEAMGDDVAVAIQWDDDQTFSDPKLILRDGAGNILASKDVVPSGPLAVTEWLPNALADVWMYDFSLVLEILDEGEPLGAPLPFFALRECSPLECVWKLLVGLEVTDGVVTSAQIDAIVKRSGLCDLDSLLTDTETAQPHLQEEVQQVRQQLIKLNVPLGPVGCGYYWHVVGDIPITPAVGDYDVHSYDGFIVDAEEGGFTGGAGYGYGAQARRLTPGVTAPPITQGGGVSTVYLDLRCSSGSPSCAQDCQGEVKADLTYSACGLVESDVYAPGGGAAASAWEEMTFAMNATPILQKTMYASTDLGAEIQTPTYTADPESGEPVSFSIASEHQLSVLASYQPPGGPLPPLPPQGAGHAFVEASNGFVLNLTGNTPGPQCQGNHPTAVTLQSPDYLDAASIQERGGIQIEKW